MSVGFRGISFPFRVGNKGGVVMSNTDVHSCPHIEESIEQILSTSLGERVMEYNVGCSLDTQIFEPNEEVTHNIIKYQIVEALKEQEPRIEVKAEDISLATYGDYSVSNTLVVTLGYTVTQYNTSYIHTFRIGGDK